MQYNLVLAKAVDKHTDWACAKDETQAKPLDRRIDRHIYKHRSKHGSGTQNILK